MLKIPVDRLKKTTYLLRGHHTPTNFSGKHILIQNKRVCEMASKK